MIVQAYLTVIVYSLRSLGTKIAEGEICRNSVHAALHARQNSYYIMKYSVMTRFVFTSPTVLNLMRYPCHRLNISSITLVDFRFFFFSVFNFFGGVFGHSSVPTDCGGMIADPFLSMIVDSAILLFLLFVCATWCSGSFRTAVATSNVLF